MSRFALRSSIFFANLKDELGSASSSISHDLMTVRYVSDRIAVMYLGEVVEYGPAELVFDDPAHPYTRALLDAIPTADPALEANRSLNLISGELPSPLNLPSGCAFGSRCLGNGQVPAGEADITSAFLPTRGCLSPSHRTYL